jgi:outer membrane protein insertion porin family
VVFPALFAIAAIQSVSIHGTKWNVPLETQVGQPYNMKTIEHDVRKLWQTGRFDDVRVETNGTSVVFNVVENPRVFLHEIRMEPHTFGLQVKVPEGTALTKLRVHEIALDVERQLNAKGYTGAAVDYDLAPFAENSVDLRLTIRPGESVRVKDVEFEGDPGLEVKELRGALRALRARRIVAWRLLPSYTPEAVDSDLARLRSLYLSKGYFEAAVRLSDSEISGRDARVRILVESGPLYRVQRWATRTGMFEARDLCSCLFAARREAEQNGILDFAARLTVQPLAGDGPLADLDLQIDRGRPYRVRRVNFSGNHHFSDATLRRNFTLDEGDLLDQRLLRESMDRLNRTTLFEPLTMSNVEVNTDEKNGAADVNIRVTERKRGAWGLSGPVGPASFAGPLQASISSRLPSWGRGLFELSTYTVSLSMIAFAHPLLPALAIASKHPLIPILALRRPFLPALGWESGFSIAPQIGWRASALGYAITQIQQRTLPLLAGDRGSIPELPVQVEGPRGEAPMFCDPPPPRAMWLRRPASFALQFLGSLAAF